MSEQLKQQQHQARQQRLKAQVDAAVARANIEKGLLLVLTGNGKGKSTAGFGTVARAVGHGLTAAVVQFIKGSWDCGERNLLQQHGVEFAVMATGFTWDTQDRAGDIAAAELVWQEAERFLADDSIDLVLLDELTYMLTFHYLPLERIERALLNRPAKQHVVITGRACHRRLIELADTVSEVQVVKHAFDAGVKAQRGLDW
ncbi:MULTISPECIES: cob(I)yrinic acid a,c-diamide adenosyltransferase [Alishewanella]|jgi:cob(I)alamin adenosyltransferase|uniref:Corrinoid adenosyltransferase n=1 Tax=Alishewanella aestuarii B11 TaxID=1197174 RepID=J2IBF0_9ALTE|nr:MULTISPECIES: cob(I)yrinic acid a,c-diamide adenosyltransferase [Alishewanella]EJI83979.1 cob(I)alamin adenolsyltransferase/cobinamide ATP-dependent adenolsyltransferase [Alishewanella aestuarii B11]MCT8125777.1 cob(I)yrinic acid a,c-diamide adenosyltransferase [Alishewanella sp. BS5-314]OCW97880.1 cob(I)yrinic acid a,c-diamide adenosyltransferase [Alishewanella sp. HH-ZS]